MSRLDLTSSTRTDHRKSETKRIRREGGVPATVYGKGGEPKSICINADDLARILKTPGGRLSLIDLEVDGKISKSHPVLIKKIQRDPITKSALHVDFHRVSLDEPVNALVPIVLVGEAPGIKQGGILEQVINDLEIRALPDRIPTHIDVDVSHLELGQSVHISDLSVPEGVEILSSHTESPVVSLRMPVVRLEEEAAPSEEGEEGATAEEETPEES